jgi:hypothetical protein
MSTALKTAPQEADSGEEPRSVRLIAAGSDWELSASSMNVAR